MSFFNPITGGGGFVGSAAGYIPFAGADGSLTDDAGLKYDAADDQLLLTGVLSMQEQAAAGTSVAGRGRLWVKNTTPCTLFFTDDTGADIDLTAGSPNNTLDNAYDQGGAGVGRAITVDSGPVQLNASVQNALGIALATTLDIRALTITEDNVARSASVVYVKRETNSTGHILDLDNWGAGSALKIDQFGSGDAILVHLASDLDNTLAQALVVTESNFNYTEPQISITRSALATGAMISLALGAATSAAIATTAGNLSLAPITTIVSINGSLMAAELAAAPADVAGYGQYWVKNDAPCTPWFTGDTGTDYQLAALNIAQYWTAGQHDTPLVMDLTGANTTIDVNARNQFYGQLSIATTELQIPTNIAAGQWFTFDIQQAAAGGMAMTFVASYDWGDAGAPDLTTLAASDYATIVCHVLSDGATIASSCSLNSSLIGAGTDNHIPRYDGTAKLQNSAWVIADTTNALSLADLEMALNPASGYGLTITQTLKDAGTPAEILTLVGAAHTAVTASTEASDLHLDIGRTVQWATGALALQRAINIEAPTYAFVGASTVTNAATVYIEGGPVAGANATLTDSWALWIGDGRQLIGLDGIGESATSAQIGLYLYNDDAAVLGTQQGSPILALGGQGWADGASASQTTIWGLQVQPDVADGATVESTLSFMNNANGGGFEVLAEFISKSLLAATYTSLRLFDYDNNAVEQVTVGAADSGGAGYKLLRIAN